MKNFGKLIGVLALILVVGFLGYGLLKGETPATSFGAASGSDHYNHEFFFAGLTKGGRVATSSLVSATLQTGFLNKDNTRIDFTPNAGSLTLTLSASSTLTSIVPKTGDTREYLICNATTTAATPFTLAFGAGLKQMNATSTYAIATGKCAQTIFSRRSDKDIDVLFDLYN